jgi:HAMP domain-containing protein
VGAVVVVVVMRLVALLDLGLIHWKKLSGQLRELHRVSEID